MRRQPKKLVIARETLHRMNHDDLRKAAAGASFIVNSCLTTCSDVCTNVYPCRPTQAC